MKDRMKTTRWPLNIQICFSKKTLDSEVTLRKVTQDGRKTCVTNDGRKERTLRMSSAVLWTSTMLNWRPDVNDVEFTSRRSRCHRQEGGREQSRRSSLTCFSDGPLRDPWLQASLLTYQLREQRGDGRKTRNDGGKTKNMKKEMSKKQGQVSKTATLLFVFERFEILFANSFTTLPSRDIFLREAYRLNTLPQHSYDRCCRSKLCKDVVQTVLRSVQKRDKRMTKLPLPWRFFLSKMIIFVNV